MLLSFVLFGVRLRSGLSWFAGAVSRWFCRLFPFALLVPAGWGFAVLVLLWVGLLGLSALLLPVCWVARFLGWLRFVRFPRPAVGWVCVPVARLSSLSVVAVRPAVVAVGSGVVSFVWCLLPQTLHK